MRPDERPSGTAVGVVCYPRVAPSLSLRVHPGLFSGVPSGNFAHCQQPVFKQIFQVGLATIKMTVLWVRQVRRSTRTGLNTLSAGL